MQLKNIKSDKRFISNQKALIVALVALVKEKPLNDITVIEVSQRAKVHRSTFYRHYHDIYDMKAKIEEALAKDFACAIRLPHSLQSSKDLRVLCYRILRFVVEYNEVFQFLFSQLDNEFLLHKFQSILFETFYIPEEHKNPMDQFSYMYVFAGLMSALQKWLQQGQPVPMDDLVKTLMENMQKGFYCLPSGPAEYSSLAV